MLFFPVDYLISLLLFSLFLSLLEHTFWELSNTPFAQWLKKKPGLLGVIWLSPCLFLFGSPSVYTRGEAQMTLWLLKQGRGEAW